MPESSIATDSAATETSKQRVMLRRQEKAQQIRLEEEKKAEKESTRVKLIGELAEGVTNAWWMMEEKLLNLQEKWEAQYPGDEMPFELSQNPLGLEPLEGSIFLSSAFMPISSTPVATADSLISLPTPPFLDPSHSSAIPSTQTITNPPSVPQSSRPSPVIPSFNQASRGTVNGGIRSFNTPEEFSGACTSLSAGREGDRSKVRVPVRDHKQDMKEQERQKKQEMADKMRGPITFGTTNMKVVHFVPGDLNSMFGKISRHTVKPLCRELGWDLEVSIYKADSASQVGEKIKLAIANVVGANYCTFIWHIGGASTGAHWDPTPLSECAVLNLPRGGDHTTSLSGQQLHEIYKTKEAWILAHPFDQDCTPALSTELERCTSSSLVLTANQRSRSTSRSVSRSVSAQPVHDKAKAALRGGKDSEYLPTSKMINSTEKSFEEEQILSSDEDDDQMEEEEVVQQLKQYHQPAAKEANVGDEHDDEGEGRDVGREVSAPMELQAGPAEAATDVSGDGDDSNSGSDHSTRDCGDETRNGQYEEDKVERSITDAIENIESASATMSTQREVLTVATTPANCPICREPLPSPLTETFYAIYNSAVSGSAVCKRHRIEEEFHDEIVDSVFPRGVDLNPYMLEIIERVEQWIKNHDARLARLYTSKKKSPFELDFKGLLKVTFRHWSQYRPSERCKTLEEVSPGYYGPWFSAVLLGIINRHFGQERELGSGTDLPTAKWFNEIVMVPAVAAGIIEESYVQVWTPQQQRIDQNWRPRYKVRQGREILRGSREFGLAFGKDGLTEQDEDRFVERAIHGPARSSSSLGKHGRAEEENEGNSS